MLDTFMIADGTAQEIKENILKHWLWEPHLSAREISLAFPAAGLAVEGIEMPEVGLDGNELIVNWNRRRDGVDLYSTLRVRFKCDRGDEQAMAKAKRAVRRCRLHLYRMWTYKDGSYMVELMPDG